MSQHQFGNQQALIDQVMQATSSLSDQEAAERYQQILRQLPPDQAAELNALALSQVSQDERRGLAGQLRQAHRNPQSPFDGYDYDDDDDEAASPMGLGRMSARAHQQDPSLFGGMFGGSNSALGGTVGKAALGALAALLIRQAMSGQGRSAGQSFPMGGDPVSSILGGLLGGSASHGRYNDSPFGGQGLPGGQGMPGGLDVGSILGGLLGGGSMARRAPQGGGLGLLLGSILGDVMDGSNSRSHRK